MKTTIEPTTLAAPKLSEGGQNPLPTTDSSSGNHPSSINHHPTIARLPKPTRDMINLMLDDGLPYKVIVDELAETAVGITPQSLADWLKGGYEDYLKARVTIEGAKTQAEFAADLLHELGDIDVTTIHRACLALAVTQIFTAIDNYGDETLRKMLHTKPASYFNLINTLCNLTDTSIKLEDHHFALESATREAPATPGPAVTTQIKPTQTKPS